MILAVVLLAGAAPGQAMTLTLDDGTPGPEPYQSWLDAAKVPLPTNDVTLHMAGCPPPGVETACARPGEIWLDTEHEFTPRQTFLHEVGHQFDYSVMTPAARQAAQFIRNDTRPWRQGPNASNERFADAWMRCALYPTIKHRWGNVYYRYSPTPRVHRSMCRLMWWAAAGYFGTGAH